MVQRWLVVGSKENYDISKARGFTLQGIKSRNLKKAKEICPGDTLLYYLTGLMKLGAVVQVTSEMIEDHTPIWTCSSKDREGRPEVYPYRFKTQPLLVPPDDTALIDVAPIHEQLSYLKKWPAKNWTLGFQGNLHLWPEADYQLAEGLLRAHGAK